MATNFVQRGNTIDVTAPAPVVSGQLLALSHTLGVAASDAGAGERVAVHIEGVFRVPKVSGAVFAVGEKLLWDASAAAFDAPTATPAEGDILGGALAVEAGTHGQTTALVKLTPGDNDLVA